MHTALPLEQRVAALEDELAALRQQLGLLISKSEHPTPTEAKNWLKDVIGSMKDFPEFEEVARLGAEIRRADRVDDQDE